jgi:hypothetical protein
MSIVFGNGNLTKQKGVSMKTRKLWLAIAAVGAVFVFYSTVISEPSFNGPGPGCDGSGCHNFTDGLVTAVPLNNTDIEVTVSGTSGSVGGELVDSNGNVVDVINSTNNNPFILIAPQAGEYIVNAGFKNPSRDWDSASVAINITGITPPEPAATIQKFELYPNHPNPFNSETMIRFSLPSAGNIYLKIYNIRGQVVKRLASKYYQAGVHSLRWDGTNDAGVVSPSGVYLVEVRSGEQRSVRQVLLSK